MTSLERVWRKSSHSGGSNGNCVEVALSWHKSSYSQGGNGNCVEVAFASRSIGIRDSKAPSSGELDIPAEAWAAFLRSALT